MRRSFLSRLRARPVRVLFSFCLVVFGLGGLSGATQPSGRGRVAEAIVEGAIGVGSGSFIIEAIQRAEQQDYEAVVIRLDTPGGLVTTTREIVQAMLEARIPVIVWVAPSAARAGSAGVFITLAGHVAAMAPATNIGAAHPVTLGGGGQGEREEGGRTQEDIMAEKMLKDMTAFAEAIARARDRNVEWAISAVRESESVPAERAVELNVVDFIAADMRELLERSDGREVFLGPTRVPHVIRSAGAPVDIIDWTLRHRFLHLIGEPTIASILLSLGVLGLLMEFYNPGGLIPGIAGAISLLFGVIGMSALPVNVGGALLLVLGVGLIVAELFVGAYGLLGITGAACFAAGGVLLVDNVGEDFLADPDFGVSPRAIIPFSLAVAGFALLVGYKAVRAWKMEPTVGQYVLIGQVASVEVDVQPDRPGKVFVNGELWNARASVPVTKGSRVRILAVDGLTLEVAPVEGSELPAEV